MSLSQRDSMIKSPSFSVDSLLIVIHFLPVAYSVYESISLTARTVRIISSPHPNNNRSSPTTHTNTHSVILSVSTSSLHVQSGVRRRDVWRSWFMNQANPSVKLLTAAHREAIWLSKLSGPCVSLTVCVSLHAKMLTRGWQMCPLRTLLFYLSDSLFISLQPCSSGQSFELHAPTCLSPHLLTAATVLIHSLVFLDHYLFANKDGSLGFSWFLSQHDTKVSFPFYHA